MTSSATSICLAKVGSQVVRRMPSGGCANSSSSFSRRRRAGSSRGRMTPAEWPMVVIFSFTVASGGLLHQMLYVGQWHGSTVGEDRTSVVWGKRGYVSVVLDGCVCFIQKN